MSIPVFKAANTSYDTTTRYVIQIPYDDETEYVYNGEIVEY